MKIITANRRQLNLCRRVKMGESDRKPRQRLSPWAWGCTALLIGLSFGGVIASSQNTATNPPDTSRVIPFLARTIEWYRQLSVEQQIATDPNDVIVVNDNRQVADQVVRLAFDYARAEADQEAKPRSTTPAPGQDAVPTQYQALIQLENKIEQQARETQAEVDALRQKVDAATGKARQQLQSQLSETQGELDLDNARRDAMRSMVEFVSGTSTNGLGATGLRAQIEELAASVPTALTTPAKTENNAAPNSSPPNPALLGGVQLEPSGIWDQTADLFTLSGKMRVIDKAIVETDALEKNSTEIRAPFVTSLRDMSNRGDELAREADTSTSAQLGQQKQQLDALTAQFKQITSVVIPLSKQDILLQLYRRNLSNWRAAVRSQFMAELRGLFVRLGFLALILFVVFGAGEVWRRAIFRYIREPRRRYQFLLLRKFALWFAVAIVVAFAFASRLGSLVTFAGLLTAGVAVALQNVILSIVGYFFLIGKFGIRVGDRVQAGGVTGTVIDIGLVRFHLMELAGSSDVATGRVVAFSNSLVFQPGAGLFKQIPGTNFVWHEIAFTLPAKADSAGVKKRLLSVVETVLADYHEELERQHQALENTFVSSSVSGFGPTAHLRFTTAGLEITIHFPVDLQHAAEIDERVTREVLNALEREPALKAGAGIPDIKVKANLAPGASS